jgi:hypothetical protein
MSVWICTDRHGDVNLDDLIDKIDRVLALLGEIKEENINTITTAGPLLMKEGE